MIDYELVRLHTVADVLREHRRSRPACIATIEKDRRFTYWEFDARVNQLVGMFLASGVAQGERVLWLAQNSLRLLEAFLACAKLGAIFCPVNWRLQTAEMVHVLKDFDPKIVLWQGAEIGEVVQAAHEADTGERLWIQCDGDTADGYEARLALFPDTDEELRLSPELPLLAIYTAGFAGWPRAALLTHSAIMYQNLIMGRAQHITHDTVILNSGPLFHLGTLMGMLATLHYGGANVFIRRMDAETVLKLIEAHRITHAFVPGPTLEQIRTINAGGRYDVSSLWAMPDASDWTSRSAMCAPAHAPIVQKPGGYGQSEVMGLLTLRSFGGEGTAGRPSPMAQVCIADNDGNEVPSGTVGEILVRGPMVMLGYHSSQGPDCDRLINGWHRTNDLGVRLVDGSISFVGPKETMIKSGKENIYPAEVERCLREHAAVKDVCVIGVPDPTWQQSVKAIVQLADDVVLEPDELLSFCRERLASYKKPKIFEYVSELPRLKTGVVDRAAVDLRHGGGGYPAS
jgi:acyl-CoA synthetase (AMP-forming)/AMP-acid ligase II